MTCRGHVHRTALRTDAPKLYFGARSQIIGFPDVARLCSLAARLPLPYPTGSPGLELGGGIVKRLLFVTLSGALLAAALTTDAYANGKDAKDKDSHKRAVPRSDSREHDRRGRDDDDRRRPDYRQDRVYRADRHFRQHDVVVVREYY